MATNVNTSVDASVDAAVSPDEMDLMLERSQRRRGGAILDEVPILAVPVQNYTETDSLAELPVISQTTDAENRKTPLGPMQFIKRKSLLHKVRFKDLAFLFVYLCFVFPFIFLFIFCLFVCLFLFFNPYFEVRLRLCLLLGFD